jgi:hypothetical protein
MITTRSKREALKLVYEDDTIDVLPISEGEAELLLESKLGQLSPDNRQLAVALDCMPLAITQAAAYIRERMPRCSVQQYRKEVEQSRKSRTGLLRRDVPLAGRDAEATNSVLLTWRISFDHIYRTRRSAAELLSLLGFCDRLAIPETLLRAGDEGSASSEGTFDLEEDRCTFQIPTQMTSLLSSSILGHQIPKLPDTHAAARRAKKSTTTLDVTLRTKIFPQFENDGD